MVGRTLASPLTKLSTVMVMTDRPPSPSRDRDVGVVCPLCITVQQVGRRSGPTANAWFGGLWLGMPKGTVGAPRLLPVTTADIVRTWIPVGSPAVSQSVKASSTSGRTKVLEQPAPGWNSRGTQPPPARCAFTTWTFRSSSVQVGSTLPAVRIW